MTAHPTNRRMAGSPTRMEAYDRRLAAIHEAGHALMAIHLGYTADAWIHRNETVDHLREKTWLGHMTMYDLPTVSDHQHVRMVAVAGMVAETLWKCGHDEEYADPWGWEDYLLDEDSMSPSDWRLAGCAPGEPDDDLFDVVAQVGMLFMGDLWSTLTRMSRSLMGDAESIHSFSYGQPALVGTGT
ncbi:hypothetical protein [Pararhizobium sp. O133]|uniref:hypothetical protein n=1 Tax=Pararhizobium sp. O133 TaxID=3449278 RepID=UPI003F68342D